MKREILFRGKRIDNSEWAYGDLIQLDNQTCIAEHSMWATEFSNGTIELQCCEVDPETVGQFIGLVDKRINKIFEGDILKASSWAFNWTVQFDKVKSRFNCIVNKQGSQNDFIPADQVLVIGNIYDNPE